AAAGRGLCARFHPFRLRRCTQPDPAAAGPPGVGRRWAGAGAGALARRATGRPVHGRDAGPGDDAGDRRHAPHGVALPTAAGGGGVRRCPRAALLRREARGDRLLLAPPTVLPFALTDKNNKITKTQLPSFCASKSRPTRNRLRFCSTTSPEIAKSVY